MNYKVSDKKIEYIDGKTYFYIDILFNDSTMFDYIMFKNFYTHVINIFQYIDNKWKSILNEYKLMTDPDCDEEGEKYSIINKKQFINIFDSLQMRIYLTQDCSTWKTFTLNEINFIKETDENNVDCKYLLNKNSNQYEFNISTDNKVTLITDKEEMNQKYIEIMKNSQSDLSFTILK